MTFTLSFLSRNTNKLVSSRDVVKVFWNFSFVIEKSIVLNNNAKAATSMVNIQI